VLLALTMANAGGAWDNAKKYVEKGNLGGKGSPVHAAAVVGDTVGDPFKDTSGPSHEHPHQRDGDRQPGDLAAADLSTDRNPLEAVPESFAHRAAILSRC
jgi:hypothetical protein